METMEVRDVFYYFDNGEMHQVVGAEAFVREIKQKGLDINKLGRVFHSNQVRLPQTNGKWIQMTGFHYGGTYLKRFLVNQFWGRGYKYANTEENRAKYKELFGELPAAS